MIGYNSEAEGRKEAEDDKGKLLLDGFSAERRLGIAFDGVTLDDPAAITIKGSHADVRLGPGPVDFLPAGDDVHVTGAPARGGVAPADACSGKFVPSPQAPKSGAGRLR